LLKQVTKNRCLNNRTNTAPTSADRCLKYYPKQLLDSISIDTDSWSFLIVLEKQDLSTSLTLEVILANLEAKRASLTKEVSEIDLVINVIKRTYHWNLKMVLLKNPLSSFSRKTRTEKEINAAGVSVWKEDRDTLYPLEKLLSEEVREGGTDTFSFLETDEKTGSDFKAVYDLHMRIDTL